MMSSGDSISGDVTNTSMLSTSSAFTTASLQQQQQQQQETTTSNHVYVRSDEYGWVPAKVLETDGVNTATVSIPNYKNEQAIHMPGGKALGSTKVQIQLADYPNRALSLQNVDEQGRLQEVQDMVDLPFLHEAAILYNLKHRHIRRKPYTRTGDIVIACNPYQWLDHLYSEEVRHKYAESLVFDTPNAAATDEARAQLEPHVYETSSLAYRGLAVDGDDQSILVSGESGAGKTETVKILLSDIASLQRHRTGRLKKQKAAKNNAPATKKPASSSSAKLPAATELSEEEDRQSPIVQRVLDSNPLLEAFGNAKTIRNDNSSRFGKFIQLQFDVEDPTRAAYMGRSVPACVLAGSKCEVYLLEKSRVVNHEEEERTYHVFYQLLAADEDVKVSFWTGLANTDHESFCYVGYTDTHVIEGMSDAERFQHTVDSLALIGIEGEDLRTLMRCICIVLQLGNLLFEPDPADDNKTIVENMTDLGDLAELMGIATANDLLAALTIRTMRARNEEFKVPLNSIQAKDSCDAFAKEIYAKAFLWLVRKINDATCAERNYEGAVNKPNMHFGVIAMLDIFGFESFEKNRFEQLCINYANEKLQQKFTQDIFRSVQAEYEYEGIELAEILYDDNTDVLDLVEGQMGLLAVLNEECVRPGGSDTGFVSKIAAVNKDSPCFVREKHFEQTEFGILHYAGRVDYDATNFVTKNMDTLPTDLQQCATKSSNDILANELTNDSIMSDIGSSAGAPETKSVPTKAAPQRKKAPPRAAPRKGGGPTSSSSAAGSSSSSSTALQRQKSTSTKMVAQTVWTKFKNQLTDLMTTLKRTRTRYIRCIKPNTLKQPLIMQHLSTVQQLRCAGVVAAVTISRSAFPNRLEHGLVLDRFKSLWSKGAYHQADEDTAEIDDPEVRGRSLAEILLLKACETIATERENGTIQQAFVMGRTRTYFRAGALEFLENERLKRLGTWATEIQRNVRGTIARNRYHQLRKLAIHVESLVRMLLARRKYLRLRHATVQTQCWLRCIFAAWTRIRLRRNAKATLIQTQWRKLSATRIFKKNIHASIIVQTLVRGSLQRPKFRKALHERREEAKLENQVLALQRKLEEMELARVEAEKRAAEQAQKAVEEAIAAAAAAAEEQRLAAAKKEAETSMDGNAEKSIAISNKRDSASVDASQSEALEGGPPASVVVSAAGPMAAESSANAQLSLQQQTLMDESGKMLEYLRKEVFKLRNMNAQMRTDFDLLKDNNQRLMDANASAGASFAALNQHTKQLAKANEKLSSDLTNYKQQVQKLSVTQVELKEELKMKQATYIAEVHSRLQYQKALTNIVDMAQERCRDSRLVEDILRVADACEADYMSGPTGMDRPRAAVLSSPQKDKESNSSLMASFRSFWS